MFNYTRNDQVNKKPMSKPAPTPTKTKPPTPIEMEVNMPAGMQPTPPPMTEVQPAGTCIYPTMPIKPSTPVIKPDMPTPPVAPPMKPSMPMPPVTPPIAPNVPTPPVMPPMEPTTPIPPSMQCPVCGNMGSYPNSPCQICGNVGMQPAMPYPMWENTGMQPAMPCPMWGNTGMQPAMPCQMWKDTGMQSTMPYPMWEDMNEQMPMDDIAKCHNDMEIAYIKKMYPPVCQKIQKYIDSELNQYDHDLSPIYEMYPATGTIDHMANCIYNNMKGDLPNVIKEYECNRDMRAPIGGSFYTLVYALLLNELYRKRMRRHLTPTYSYPFYNY